MLLLLSVVEKAKSSEKCHTATCPNSGFGIGDGQDWWIILQRTSHLLIGHTNLAILVTAYVNRVVNVGAKSLLYGAVDGYF